MSYNYNSYSQGAQGGGYQQQHQQQQQQGYGGNYGGGGGGYGGGYGQQQQQGRYPPQGSYSQQQQAPPPQGGNSRDQLWQWFAAVDVDRSGEITAEELKQALVNGDWSPFDIDTVKLLMNIFDTDRTGTIAFEEFQGLWQYIKDWQRVFRHFDADSSGTIEANELSRALNQFGYNLSPKLLTILERKYDIHGKNKTEAGSLPTKGNQINGITFDRFVRCCVVVKSLTESFQKLDGDRDGWVNMSYEQFMDIVLASP